MENVYLEVNGSGRMKSVRYSPSSYVFADERGKKLDGKCRGGVVVKALRY
jgi:hypothetical protein